MVLTVYILMRRFIQNRHIIKRISTTRVLNSQWRRLRLLSCWKLLNMNDRTRISYRGLSRSNCSILGKFDIAPIYWLEKMLWLKSGLLALRILERNASWSTIDIAGRIFINHSNTILFAFYSKDMPSLALFDDLIFF